MTPGLILLLGTAGFIGGIINALAGGATLITFPVLLLAGLPPQIANASNAVAISPGHILAALADREKLPAHGLAPLCLLAAAGGALGAALLLLIPERWAALPVPALIALATALFAAAPLLPVATADSARWPGRRLALLAAASIYGGFFGAGLGILLTALLARGPDADLRAAKALKNLLASAVSLAAVTTFIVRGAVAWPATLAMLAGALAGGYAGGHLIRRLPARWLRTTIIVAGVILTVVHAAQYWG